jgi:hypothetical protein
MEKRLHLRGVALTALLAAAWAAAAPAYNTVQEPQRIPTLTRLRTESLAALRRDVENIRSLRRPVPTVKGEPRDITCVFHAHNYLSHDSRGTVEDMAAAAAKVGVQALFLTNHPRQFLDVVTCGERGLVNGVLFVPGSEAQGLQIYPRGHRLPLGNGQTQTLANIAAEGGLSIAAHPEEPHDWNNPNLHGMEIYNLHADFNDEKELLRALTPKDTAGYARLLELLNGFKDYPHEALAALQDHPGPFLARYDTLSQSRRIIAAAGNDSHQNTGFVVYGAGNGKYRLTDPLGDEIATLDAAKTPALRLLFGEPAPGRELFRRQLDPYPVSLGFVSTHVLAHNLTENDLRNAAALGRTYIAFDWMVSAAGSRFVLRNGPRTQLLGSRVPFRPAQRLEAHVPVPCRLRLLKDGNIVAENPHGTTLTHNVSGPGVYRWEASLKAGGEWRDWILTGAIVVQ